MTIASLALPPIPIEVSVLVHGLQGRSDAAKKYSYSACPHKKKAHSGGPGENREKNRIVTPTQGGTEGFSAGVNLIALSHFFFFNR